MINKGSDGFRCGMVTIVGRPNVGKSTLVNNILGEKITIVSKVPQTTRNQIRGIYNDERGQIIFIDTPGLHLAHDKLDSFMNQSSAGTIDDADCIIYLVDTSRRIGEEEENIAARLKDVKVPIILALNKIDLKGKFLPDYISFWEQAKGKPVNELENFKLIALSGEHGSNVDELISIAFDFLPVGPPAYPDDIICDVPQKMALSDIIREKFLQCLRDELPHSIGVCIEHMQPKKKKTMHIKALIMVERSTQKEIVIGKNGKVLKDVGTKARVELEELLECRVYLDLFVKVEKDWRQNVGLLQELGYYG